MSKQDRTNLVVGETVELMLRAAREGRIWCALSCRDDEVKSMATWLWLEHVAAPKKRLIQATSEEIAALRLNSVLTTLVMEDLLFSEPALVIEHVGMGDHDATQRQIHRNVGRVLDRRYDRMLPTLMTTSMELEELLSYFDERFRDRWQEVGEYRVLR